jgi:hypothetical protein
MLPIRLSASALVAGARQPFKTARRAAVVAVEDIPKKAMSP